MRSGDASREGASQRAMQRRNAKDSREVARLTETVVARHDDGKVPAPLLLRLRNLGDKRGLLDGTGIVRSPGDSQTNKCVKGPNER
jgi:hypothetical protein